MRTTARIPLASETTMWRSTGLAGQIMSTFTRLRALYRERRAITQLQDMDDRMLADIGLTRSDLRSAIVSQGRQGATAHLAEARRRRLRAGRAPCA
jgi:uncharacterized protein YjiS (DUF1127 family)